MSDDVIEWVTVKRKISDLKDFDYNPRSMNKDDFARLVRDIQEDGYHTRIKVSTDNIIVGGHSRKRALLKAGFKNSDEIEVLTPSKPLTAEQFERVNIRDNLSFGSWDPDMLANHFDQDDLIAWGMPESFFDIEAEEIEVTEEDNEVPGLKQEAITKLGDIWRLGEHRLMCGDSTSFEDLDKLMDGEIAKMVFTDPPYDMNFTGSVHADGSKSQNSKYGKIENDNMSPDDARAFFDAINTMIAKYSTGAFYICFYRLGIGEYWASLTRSSLDVRALIIWNKGNHTLSNSDYMSKYEPIFYGWVKDHNFYGGNNGMDIWDISRTKINDLHPTMKPIELVLKAITDSSRKGDLILDLFGGSGCTIIAAEKANRRCFTMELSPNYVDVIIARWEKLTGQKAVLT